MLEPEHLWPSLILNNNLSEVVHWSASTEGTWELTGTTVLSSGHSCLIRMHAIPQLKTVDRWTEKRSMFGVYDNIGILGKCQKHVLSIEATPLWVWWLWSGTISFYFFLNNSNFLMTSFCVQGISKFIPKTSLLPPAGWRASVAMNWSV